MVRDRGRERAHREGSAFMIDRIARDDAEGRKKLASDRTVNGVRIWPLVMVGGAQRRGGFDVLRDDLMAEHQVDEVNDLRGGSIWSHKRWRAFSDEERAAYDARAEVLRRAAWDAYDISICFTIDPARKAMAVGGIFYLLSLLIPQLC